MAAPTKKRKTAQESGKHSELPKIKYPDTIIFIVERRIQRLRIVHMKNLARKKGFAISDTLDESVTHIVSELETGDQVAEVLKLGLPSHGEVPPGSQLNNAEIVSTVWFCSCMEEGRPVPVKQEHRLKSAASTKVRSSACPSDKQVRPSYQDARYCCQRVTPLNHHNRKLTDALEVLEKQADFLGGDVNASRALAFCKASAALKALPRAVRSMHEVENLCDLRGGRHCKQVIQDILEEGFCPEVENILSDEWFKTMKVFTAVFGCGATTARKWSDLGLRALQDVRDHAGLALTAEQKHGLEFYEDINTPVTRQEAEAIQRAVAAETEAILPGTNVTITGGFSRGKATGHDVDLLISHPEEGREKGLLRKLLIALQRKGFLEYTDVQNSSYSEAAVRQVRRNQTMDHFERCFSIFRLPSGLRETEEGSDLKDAFPSRGGDSVSAGEQNHSSAEAAKRPPETDLTHQVLVDPTSVHATRGESRDNLRSSPRECHTERDTEPRLGMIEEGQGATESSTYGDKVEVSAIVPERDSDVTTLDSDAFDNAGAEGKTMVVAARDEDPLDGRARKDRDWAARRVDFIIAPASQYPYALLGWTGSRMFNRSMRDYATREMNMTLTSHGLFDKSKNVLLPANSQREIFEHLKLNYREPHERNC